MAENPVVRIPRAARSSFNPNRPLEKNTLLLNQLRHFAHVEGKLPPEERTGMDVASIRTEGQAAEYIRRMTRKLHVPGES
jgi:hypothetical protein